MAKIARKHQKIFALANDASQRFGNGQFGSGKTGTKVITNDVEQLQLLAAFDDGWKDAVLVNGAGQPTLPPLPEMQTLDYIETYQLAYLFQEGVPEYNADTTYFINSIVKAPGTYNLYGSIIDDNIGNSISDPTKWKYLVNLSTAVMTANTASIANEIVLYDGTGGRDIKRATTTGILKGTSGVLSAATSGTDYSAGTSGLSTGILKSTTSTGALTIASAGTDYLTPAGSGAALTGITASQISGLGPFVSSGQTLTLGGTLTIAHGLGVQPAVVNTRLVCASTNSGYTSGDIVYVANTTGDAAGNQSGGAITADSTNIYVKYNSTGFGAGTVYTITNKSTGGIAQLTNANWNAVFVASKY